MAHTCKHSVGKSDTVALSVIICTRNRSRRLESALTAVGKMVCTLPWELIIVDNGSTDETVDVVCHAANLIPAEVSYVFEPVPGLCRARNAGLKRSRGRIVVLTDDDCYPQVDYLDQVAAAFEDDRIFYCGGRVLLFDTSDAHVTVKESEETVMVEPGSFIEAGFVHGANLAFRRSLAEAIGGFDETLDVGTRTRSGGDIEFVARASALGYLGGYFPGPTVSHHHGRKPAQLEPLLKGYDIGRGAYIAAMILQPLTRTNYIKHWYWSAALDRRTVRECVGAAIFLITSLWLRLRRRHRIPVILRQDVPRVVS